jgi:hypothetical protein
MFDIGPLCAKAECGESVSALPGAMGWSVFKVEDLATDGVPTGAAADFPDNGGNGRPWLPGKGWPSGKRPSRCVEFVAITSDPCEWLKATFFAIEGGSAGASARTPAPWARLAADETIWPLRSLMVTSRVAWLKMIVLWMLLKITLSGGGAT